MNKTLSISISVTVILFMLYFALNFPFNDGSGIKIAELFAQYGDFIGGTLGTLLSAGTIIYLIIQNKKQENQYEELSKDREYDFYEKRYFSLLEEYELLINRIIMINFNSNFVMNINENGNYIELNNMLYSEIHNSEIKHKISSQILIKFIKEYDLLYFGIKSAQIRMENLRKDNLFDLSEYTFIKIKPYYIINYILLLNYFIEFSENNKQTPKTELNDYLLEQYYNNLKINYKEILSRYPILLDKFRILLEKHTF